MMHSLSVEEVKEFPCISLPEGAGSSRTIQYTANVSSIIPAGNEYLRETLEGLGAKQGVLQLDYEIQARIGNLQHDIVGVAKKTLKWTKKTSSSWAKYYLFAKR